MTEQPPGKPKPSYLGSEEVEPAFELPKGEKLPYSEIHEQAKALLTQAREIITVLPGFRDATAPLFWIGGNTVNFKVGDFESVHLTYYGSDLKKSGAGDTQSIHILKSSIEDYTDVSITFGYDEETNRRIAYQINYKEDMSEAPRTSGIRYEGPRVRDENGHIKKVQNTQQAIDEVRKFIESFK